MTFRIAVEWEDGSGVRDEAEAATWARIETRVGDTVASQLVDERTPAVRKGFYGSALPLAEWVADSWPRLVHERRLPPRGSDDWHEWAGYHGFRAARQGGAMPDLRVVRHSDDWVRVSCVPDGTALAPGITVRFISRAVEWVPLRTMQSALASFVEATLDRLGPVDSPRAERLMRRWRSVRDDRVAALAARLGLDDEAIGGPDGDALRALAGKDDAGVVADVAEASTAPSVAGRIEAAEQALLAVPAGTPVGERWRELVGRLVAERHDRPWKTGWRAARVLRQAVGAGEEEPPGERFAEWVAERCGWDAIRSLGDLPADLDGIETVHVRRAGRTPALGTRFLGRPEAVRFRLARTLYYFLFSRSGDRDSAVADSPLRTRERSEANAFAAEMLAPVAWMRTVLPAGSTWSEEAVESAAGRAGVSAQVIRHQVENRRLGMLME